MSIIRNAHTVIPNDLINDPDLGGNELALLVFLLSDQFNKPLTLESLVGSGRFGGTSKIANTLCRLRELGYLKLEEAESGETEFLVTDERGTFGGAA